MPFDRETAEADAREEIWLLGQPPLADYVDYVRESVVGGAEMSPRALCDAWRLANDRYHELERTEAGLADKAGCRPLPEAMRPLADALAARPHFRQTFDRLPVSFGMVELDRLVVRQIHVSRPHVEALRARLDPVPDEAALFRFCHPDDRSDPPVSMRRLGDGRWQFVCESTDFRPHEPVLLRGERAPEIDSFGPVAAMVGLAVGFGSNVLNVIRSDRRMLLHNGYHRACALRAAGLTHAPAVIQDVTRRDELALTATQTVIDDPAFYFAAKRPPLLKDFFDPTISTVLPTRRQRKVIEIRVEIEEFSMGEA